MQLKTYGLIILFSFPIIITYHLRIVCYGIIFKVVRTELSTMKRKWPVLVGLLVLLINLVPSIFQTYTVSATAIERTVTAPARQGSKASKKSKDTPIMIDTKKIKKGAEVVPINLKRNASPQYRNDGNGVYPTNSWIPAGNQTVINHQGRKYGATNWDGNTGWSGDPRDTTSSYIEYGSTEKEPDYAVRKFAKETQTPGLYDVYLNVRGYGRKNIEPMDIVLVVDMSSSMEPDNKFNPSGSPRSQAIRNGVGQFLQEINASGMARYVNVGLIGYSNPGSPLTGPSGVLGVNIQPIAKYGHIAEINNKLRPKFSGATFTQLGIRKGTEMLRNTRSNNQKKMILLTDGVPTFAFQVRTALLKNNIVYGTSFTNNIHNPGYTSQLWSTNNPVNRIPVSYMASGYRIADTWPATLGEAKISKDMGVELHALGIQIGKDFGYTEDPRATYMTEGQVRSRMALLASSDLYRDANSASDIEMYLKEQAKNVVTSFNTIVSGSISDPIGQQFVYNGTSVEVKSVGSSRPMNLPTAKIKNNKVDVSNINLGDGQEIQIHYQVRLNTETREFVPDKWYQMNGQTTLTPDGYSPNNKVDFGVPSAKGPGVKLDLTKIWEEPDGDSSQRPTSITYEVGRTQTTIANAWQKGYAAIDGKPDNETWRKSVQQLSTEKNRAATLWLPKYNVNGAEFNYAITSEINVPGYKTSLVNDTTVKNSKQFNGLKLEVLKTDTRGKKLSGATFKLSDSKGIEINGTTSSDGTLFSYSSLKPGNYTLTEVIAPEGYAILKSQIKIEIQANGSVKIDNQSVKVENGTIKLTVSNQQKGILPMTGGSGKTGYWIAGTILMLATLVVGVIYFRIIRSSRLTSHKQGRKKKIKLGLPIVLVLLGVPHVWGEPITVNASVLPEPVSFVLHKRVFRDSERLKTTVNTGLVISKTDQSANDFVNESLTYGLNGARFAVYDATQYVTDKLVKMSTSELLTYVTNAGKAEILAEIGPYQSKIQDVITSQLGNEDGVASLTVTPISETSAYLFLETGIAASDVDRVNMSASPMLVILPVQNPMDKTASLTTIHLYPKNTQVNKIVPPNPSEPKVPPKSELVPPDQEEVPPFLSQAGEVNSLIVLLGILMIGGALTLCQKRRKVK